MDKRRIEIGQILKSILGSSEVYFQPPASVRMSYPAIVYSRKRIDNKHANNSVYMQFYGFEVVVIDPNPDSEIVEKISRLPSCSHDRHYKKDNLNHDIFTLY